VNKITDNKVVVSKNHDKNVPNPFNTWNPLLPENISNPLAKKIGEDYKKLELDYDMLLFAAGVKKNDALYYLLQKSAKIKELYNIGDSCNLGRVFEAIKAAYHVGTLI
jgi:2-enoate reductase